MKMWNEYTEETRELLNELDNAEVEYETREHGKVFVNVTNGDTLEGIWSIQYEPYWGAWKVIWYFLEDNEIKSAKTVCWDTQQILEDILA